MNFFQHQDAARRRTGRLVVLFALAVVAIMATIYLLIVGLLAAGEAESQPFDPRALWNPSVLAATVLSVGAVITTGSSYRIATLHAGGKVIAETLGGRLLTAATGDWRERRLLNVVEEMAIASGVPVPAVYVMDREEGVNAFAAGFSPTDAVIGVTRGTMQTLTRDELQGVVAHEFSHVLNGDMRLNLRLVGVLHGILLLSLIGYFLMRVLMETRPRSSRSSGGKKGDSGSILLAVFLFGLGLYVIGYIGVFFGKLIKSAVSRQREYLADASAVQFTRNPLGIAGALKKIGALGSRINNSQAEQASHMFFGDALRSTFLNMLATHPPLIERIRRIEPNFDGDFSRERLTWPTATEEPSAAPSETKRAAHAPVLGGVVAAAGVARLSTEQAMADVGTPRGEHLAFAAEFLSAIPSDVRDAIHEPAGAAALVFALLLTADESDDEPALQRLAQTFDGSLSGRVRRLIPQVDSLGPAARLPLAHLAMSALRQLTVPQFEAFRKVLIELVRADRRVSMFEYGLQRMVIKHLADFFRPRRPTPVRFQSTAQVVESATTILAALAYAGTDDRAEATAAFAAGMAKLDVSKREISTRDACGFAALDAALDAVSRASGAVKERILQAAAETIGHDGRMTIDEAELLRIVAEALDCPMPPPAATLTASV